MEGYKAPWEEPEVQMAVSILGGKIVTVQNIAEINFDINSSKEFTNEDR